MSRSVDRSFRTREVIALVALLSSCRAVPPPRVPTPSEVEALPAVVVGVAPGIPADRLKVFDEQDGSARLRNALLDQLLATRDKHPVLQASELRVSVTTFRLRSKASVFWFGAFAGADMLGVTVTLVRDDKTTRTFDTGSGTITGAFHPSVSGRYNRLVRIVAKKIVARL